MYADEINKEFYNANVDNFDKIPFENILIPLLLKYLSKSSCDLLEIGSGPGALAVWISKFGHSVTCIEPAEKPAEKARKRGLNVYLLRFQDFSAIKQFDCIIAISSLIHIPRLDIHSQIEKMSRLLKQEGIAFVSFLEGDGEEYGDPTKNGMTRFFSRFTQKELNQLLSPYFSIIEVHRVEVKTMSRVFFLMVLKKK